MAKQFTIGFLGAGKMAGALASGLSTPNSSVPKKSLQATRTTPREKDLPKKSVAKPPRPMPTF